MNEMSEVWCAKCAAPAEEELRTVDGGTVALCHEHVLEAKWMANAPSWKGAK